MVTSLRYNLSTVLMKRFIFLKYNIKSGSQYTATRTTKSCDAKTCVQSSDVL